MAAANLLAVLVLLRLLAGPDGEAPSGSAARAVPATAGAEAAPELAFEPLRQGQESTAPGRLAPGERVWAQGASDGPALLATEVAAPPERPSVRPTPAPTTTKPVRRERALEERLRARIGASLESARGATKGAVTGANTTVAVCVRVLGRPGTLAELSADRALRPASNMKLVTAAAALVLLGPGAQLETRFESAAPPRGGVLEELVVRAGGDPLFDPGAEGRVDHLLAPLVAELWARGVRRIEGDLVLDEGGYARPGPGPGWPDASQYWQEHCALAGGFSANAGCLTALVRATEVGALARAEVFPRHHGLARRGEVRTVASPPLDVRVGVQGVGARQVVLEGTVPASVARWSARFAHPDPVELFGNVLVAALGEGGIELVGGVRREARPAGLETLAVLRTPVISLLGPINTDSNNAVADQLFLALGGAVVGEPTRAGGARATGKALERLGVSAAGLVQVDGSGLSREDRISARQLAALLDAVLSEPGERAEAFRASLAVGGETGTLSDRFRQADARGRVWAKTGFIGGTSSLSGLLVTDGGRHLVFSILIEYPRHGGLNTSHWKPLQDALVGELLRHG